MNKKLTKTLAAFLVALTVISSLGGCAGEEQEKKKSVTTTAAIPDSLKVSNGVDESFAYTIYKDYAEIDAYIGGGAVVIVPAQFEGTPVLSIGKSAFYGNTIITKVTLPKTVVNIGNKAFAKCENLTEIEMPGVKAFGMEAFKGSGIEEVTIPTVLENLGKYAFSETKLKSVMLPASIVRAGDYTFSGCEYLTGVTFPATMTEITARMFYCCNSLTEVTVPEQITSIGEYAYSSCANLTKLTVGPNVTEIGEGLLYNSPNAKLYVQKGSYAEQYAKNHGFAYEYVGK